MRIKPEEISKIIRSEIENYKSSLDISNTGTVLEVGDGIARIYGLSDAMAGELLQFENGTIGSCEATRMAWGRNNYITLEVHGTKGSISWCYERLNELNVCYGMEDQDGERGFKTIYTGPANPHGDVTWNIPGMNIGYGELKAIEMYEFGKAIVEGYQPSTNFGVGYRLDRVCDAILESNEKGAWVKVK